MLANTEVRGNMKPADFDKALYKAICKIQEENYFELNKWVNRMNKGQVNPGEENIIDLLQQKVDFHLESKPLTYSSSKFTLPDDLRYLGTVVYTTTNSEVDICKNLSEFTQLKRFKHTQPSTNFPIGFVLKKSIEILPSSIQNNVIASYKRNPIPPKWTYLFLGGAEVFNPDAPDFSDIDMHPSEFDKIITELCIQFGINLKEDDLKNAGQQEDIQTFNKENSN